MKKILDYNKNAQRFLSDVSEFDIRLKKSKPKTEESIAERTK